MPTYILNQDCNPVSDSEDLDQVLSWGEENLRLASEPTTFTVIDDNDQAVAVFTNRRIVGEFCKQVWGGRKQNDAIEVETVEFDATDAILNMSVHEIHDLEDNSETSDQLGQIHIGWDGPHEVTICQAVQHFFGVELLEQITESAVKHARDRINPRKVVEEKVKLTIEVNIFMKEPEDEQEKIELLSAFTENLDYSITSNTVGVAVKSTEITDC